jgi:hypothetical protein
VKIDPKWHFIGALTLAGLLSLYTSFNGLMGFLWGGFPRQKFPIPLVLLFLAPILALPLFALAAASFRLASFCLWALGPAYSLALFQINADSFVGSFIHYLGLLVACLCDRVAIMLWITAWLVHFGTRIYDGPRGPEPAATIGQVK